MESEVKRQIFTIEKRRNRYNVYMTDCKEEKKGSCWLYITFLYVMQIHIAAVYRIIWKINSHRVIWGYKPL